MGFPKYLLKAKALFICVVMTVMVLIISIKTDVFTNYKVVTKMHQHENLQLLRNTSLSPTQKPNSMIGRGNIEEDLPYCRDQQQNSKNILLFLIEYIQNI